MKPMKKQIGIETAHIHTTLHTCVYILSHTQTYTQTRIHIKVYQSIHTYRNVDIMVHL